MRSLVLLLLLLPVASRAPAQDATAQGTPAQQLTPEQQADIKQIQQLNAEMEAAFKEEKWIEGAAAAERCATICNRLLGTYRQETAYFLHQLGHFQQAMGNLEPSAKSYASAIAIRRKILGDDHQHVALSLDSLGAVLSQLGRYQEALACHQHAMPINQKRHGERSDEVAVCHLHLAQAFSGLNRHVETQAAMQTALDMRVERFGKEHVETGKTLEMCASLMLRAGDTRASIKYHELAIATYRKALGPKDRTTLRAMASLSAFYVNSGDLEKGRDAAERYLKVCEEVYGSHSVEMTQSLCSIGSVYTAMFDFQTAYKHYERARKLPGWENEDDTAALLWHEYAHFMNTATHFDEAHVAYQRAVDIYEKLGKLDSATASLQGLAGTYDRAEEYDKAREIVEKLLAQRLKVLGPYHLEIAHLRGQLGYFFGEMGETEKAIEQLQAAKKIGIADWGPDNPDYLADTCNLAIFFSRLDRWEEAFAGLDEWHHGAHASFSRILPGMVEREQFLYTFRINQPALPITISMAKHRRDDPKVAEMSAEWVLNTKGRMQEILGERSLLARATRDPALAEIARRLAEVRAKQASVRSIAEQEPLAVEEEQLTRQLSAQGALGQTGRKWVKLTELRKRLAPDQVLVSILHHRDLKIPYKNRNDSWNEDRYGAWIIPPQGGQVRLIDLGKSAPIDEQVARMYAGTEVLLRDRDGRSPDDLMAAARLFSEGIVVLSKLLLKPIVEHCENAQELVISPDSGLWLIPWSGLVLPDQKFAIERYRIRLVVSGRELLEVKEKRPSGRSLIIADPDFDLDAKQAEELAAKILGSGKLEELKTTGAPQAKGHGAVKRLPGSAREAAAVATELAKYDGKPPAVFTGAHALEPLFKAVHSPRVILLSTHGYYQLPPATDAQGVQTAASGAPINPLLRCGVTLAGCNQAVRDQGEDGILLGLEILGIDLRGTELVVLNACDTGVGDPRMHEGIAGLRQAFQLAGAREVVSTLWPVGDEESGRQSSDLFKYLASGQNTAKALQSSQLNAIRRLKEKKIPPHPLFWAAFTLTGM